MSPALRPRFAACLPAIKTEWRHLLRSEPVLTPLGRPDTLVYLMDTTLRQVADALAREHTGERSRGSTPVIGSVHTFCPCGLNPLLKYYGTGELALRAGAGARLGEDFEVVLQVFRKLARQEIQELCAVCRHREAAPCAAIARE